MPARKRRQVLAGGLIAGISENAPDSCLHKGGHGCPAPRRLAAEALRDGVRDVQGHLHLANPIPMESQPPRKRSAGRAVPFEEWAYDVFRRYTRRWKPRTLAVNRSYLRNQILPWFRHRPVTEITRSEVERWFASLRATPAAANRSLPILSVVLAEAEVHGHRPDDSNPCRGLRRYPDRARERFLTAPETHRLGAALTAREAAEPVCAAAVRLLLLTGCRQGEIRTLQWRDYREGNLFLRDSKTGPRTVWLSSPARYVLDRLPRRGLWVLPGARGDGPLAAESLYRFWLSVRAAVGLPDVRLHDLRHSYASFALQQGENVPTIGRLLGHRNPATTLRYVHVADGMVRDAVEAVGAALGPG